MADDGHIMSHVLKLLRRCAAWKRKQDTDVQTDCWQIIDLREIFIKEPRPAGFNGPLKFYRLFNSCFNARWVLGSHVLKHSLGSSPSASSGSPRMQILFSKSSTYSLKSGSFLFKWSQRALHLLCNILQNPNNRVCLCKVLFTTV